MSLGIGNGVTPLQLETIFFFQQIYLDLFRAYREGFGGSIRWLRSAITEFRKCLKPKKNTSFVTGLHECRRFVQYGNTPCREIFALYFLFWGAPAESAPMFFAGVECVPDAMLERLGVA